MAILLAEFVPVLTLQQLVVIGTLFAFVVVAGGVIVMRQTMPRPGPRLPGRRSRRCCPTPRSSRRLWLMVNLQVLTWLWFVLWMAFGLLVYLVYGRRNSLLAGDGLRRSPAVIASDTGPGPAPALEASLGHSRRRRAHSAGTPWCGRGRGR